MKYDRSFINTVSHTALKRIAFALGTALLAMAMFFTVYALAVTSKADTGIQACKTMRQNRLEGTDTSDGQSEQLLSELRQSRNKNLQVAGRQLADEGFQGLGPLFTGCAEVGVPLYKDGK